MRLSTHHALGASLHSHAECDQRGFAAGLGPDTHWISQDIAKAVIAIAAPPGVPIGETGPCRVCRSYLRPGESGETQHSSRAVYDMARNYYRGSVNEKQAAATSSAPGRAP